MRFVNKEELLQMPPCTMFRPTYDDCVESCHGDPEIKTGTDFGGVIWKPTLGMVRYYLLFKKDYSIINQLGHQTAG